jgi:predicted DNA-binding transcriptional regulator AlpA
MPLIPIPHQTETSTTALGVGAQNVAQQLMTKDEFSAVVNRSPRTIDRWVRNRTAPPHVPLGSGIAFRVEAVTEWLKRNEVRAEAKSRNRRG